MSILRPLPVLVLWLAIAMVFPAPVRPDEPPGESGAGQSASPWHISADKVYLDERYNEYIAEGHVTLSRDGRTLTADQVRYNHKTQQASAKGNVILEQGQDRLTGSSIEMNLETETGELQNGMLFLKQNHIYVTGERIRKTGPETYSIRKAGLTSCDGPNPDWRITTSELDVTIEGYGKAKHAAFWAKKIPLLYAPYFIFPVKLKRQTGLLMPEFGYSVRRGDEYLQPFFWAISDSTDATLYAHFMSKRGLRGGLEYRYVLGKDALGTLMADGFIDRQVDDGQDNSSELWGYEDDAFPRPNEDRYWLRAKADQPLPAGLTAKLDIDIVSDQDYLHEFSSGANGYKKTDTYFTNTFGRDLDDDNDPVRLNLLNVNRIWQLYSFNADVRWYDDVIKRRQAETDNTLQQLPSVSFDGLRQGVGASPLYFDLSSNYVHFYRQTGDRGHRLDVYPRLYIPFFLFDGISVEPSAGVRQTFWRMDHYEQSPEDERNDYYRHYYDLKLDIRTEFYNVFDIDLAGADRLKHAISPEIVYEYIPEKDQSEYPQFDSLDTIERLNRITYGLTNTLTARLPKQAADSQDQVMNYVTFFRFKLMNSFDINTYNEYGDNTASGENETRDYRPFSDITAEVDLTPGRYISLDGDASWSPYDFHFTSHNATLRLWDGRGDRLDTTYRYTRESEPGEKDGIESIDISGNIVVNDQWRLRGGYEFNLYDGLEIESQLGISYKSKCWGVDFDYVIEDDDRSYIIMFNLTGLGTIGG